MLIHSEHVRDEVLYLVFVYLCKAEEVRPHLVKEMMILNFGGIPMIYKQFGLVGDLGYEVFTFL